MGWFFQKKDKQEKETTVQTHKQEEQRALTDKSNLTSMNQYNNPGDVSLPLDKENRPAPVTGADDSKIGNMNDTDRVEVTETTQVSEYKGNIKPSNTKETDVQVRHNEHVEGQNVTSQREDAVSEDSTAKNNKADEAEQSTKQPMSAGIDEKSETDAFEKLIGAAKEDVQKSWKEIDGRYIFGEQSGTFKQIPYPSKQDDKNKYHKPDLIADIAQIDRLLVLGASLRGESHYAYESVRQDSFSIEELRRGDKHYVIASIADGVGNAVYSDQFADLLVNNISIGIKEQLIKCQSIDKIDWDYIANYIWKVSREYCRRKTGSENLKDYYGKWASTLEFIIIDAAPKDNNEFVHVTISGDGGSYIIDGDVWHVVKKGKRVDGKFISNDVMCLPDKPVNPVIRYGRLKTTEMLFLVTDGLGDCVEESSEFRSFIGSKLQKANNLPAYISVICTSIDQMDDDKTGILIKHNEV